MIIFGIFIAGLLAVLGAENIEDGVSVHEAIDSLMGGTRVYKFRLREVTENKDLSISVTTFSDWSDPNLYVAEEREPSAEDHDWASLIWGSDSVVIPPQALKSSTDYYITVSCFTYCRYTLTASYIQEIQLVDGQPIDGSLKKGHNKIYNFTVLERTERMQVIVMPTKGSIEIFVTRSDMRSSIYNSLPITESWYNGQIVTINEPPVLIPYRVLVQAIENADFTIKASTYGAVHLLKASMPTQGSVGAKLFDYYKVYVDTPKETLLIDVSPFTGDPDIYVKYDEKPTLTDYHFRSLQFGNETLAITKHDRQVFNQGTGWYVIGIYGFTHSQYTITATNNDDSSIPLVPGVPQSGYSDFNELDLYYIDMPDIMDQNITISLSVLQGNPDLYAKLCPRTKENCILSLDDILNPSKNNDIYSSLSETGEDIIYISHKPNSSLPIHYRYVVGVLGKSEERSSFIITASLYDDTEHVLMDGVPWRMTVPKEGYRYFRYTIDNPVVTNITFILTPISGDPDLYVSRTVTMPDYDRAEKVSRNTFTKVDSVVYSQGVDGSYLNGTYHLTVYSMSVSTFTILAQLKETGQNSTIALLPGHPQSDTLYNLTDSDYRLYSFNLDYNDLTKQPVRVVLTPISGVYDIYVTSDPNNLDEENQIFYYDWCTESQNRSDYRYVINIKTSSRHYKPSSTYLILVIAREFSSENSASYSIMYSTGNWPVRLSEGVGYMDEVNGENSKYYLFPIASLHEDVSITLTALTGDPDLFLSLDPNNPRPSREKYDYSSAFYGSEKFTLNWEAGISQACPDLPIEPSFGEKTHCMLYISVSSFEPSTYSILITARRQYPTQLILNFPQSGQLEEGWYDYYFTYLDPSKIAEISLQAKVGDADLYVNILDKEYAGNDVTGWNRPIRDSSMYYSMSLVSTEHIQIDSEELVEICSSGECVGVIGVYCYSEMCRYTLSGRQNNLFVLSEGEFIYGVVNASSYKYYDFYNDREDATLLITLTCFSDGEPDLYVSKGSDARPNQNDFTWSAATWESESLLISKDDPFLKNSSMQGHYIIGVYGRSMSAYTITVSLNPSPVTNLISGQPFTSSQDSYSKTNFSFYNSLYSRIKITITPSSGSANIYANSQDEVTQDMYEMLPSEWSFMWSGFGYNDPYSIVIETSDYGYCTMCNILIAVITDESWCNYNIVVKNDETVQMLQNGVQSKGSLKADEWSYYYFAVYETSDFDISVTAYSGNPDVYISISDGVSFRRYDWTSATLDTNEHVFISKDDPQFKLGRYTIGVYSIDESTYSISVHTRESLIEMVDGWPQTYSLSRDDSDHLFFLYSFGNEYANITSCYLRPLTSNFFPRVYVSYKSSIANTPEKPSPTTYRYKYDEVSDYKDPYDDLIFTLRTLANSGGWIIGVYGRQDNDHSKQEMGSFELQCSANSEMNILRVGQDTYDVFRNSARSKKYELNVNEKGTLEVFVVPCAGRVKMEISSNYTIVTQDLPDVEVMTLVEGKLIGTINNAYGKYFVTIRAISGDSWASEVSYQLTSRFTPKGNRPASQYVPGNNGFIQWERKGKETVKLTWGKLAHEDGTPVSLNNLEYLIFWTEEAEIPMNTVCGISTAARMDSADLKSVSYDETSAEVSLKFGKKITVNIVGAIPDMEESLLKYIPYYPIEIDMSARPKSGGVGYTVMWIGAAVILVTLLASFVFYKKYKKVQRRLEYEMTDVRNVAGISSGSLEQQALSNIK